MKNDLLRYRAKIDADDEGGDIESFGIRQIAFVKNPAIKIKGLAFSCEKRQLMFSDEPKMRLASPVMAPGITYRKAKDGEPEYEVEITREDVEKTFLKLMSNPENLRNVFNTEHNAEQTAPAYILEIWLIGDNPKGDRSFTEFGIECEAGTIFAVAQITDKEYYDTIVKEDRLGFSFEGQFGLELQYSEELKNYADVIVLNEDGNVLFLKRTPTDEFEPNKWGLAGGKIEEGEDTETSARRELEEEAGIIADELVYVDEIVNSDGTKSTFYATLNNGETAKISDEHVEMKFVSGEELQNLDVIMSENSKFIQLYEKAKSLLTNTNKKMKEGEKFQIGENWFIVKEGMPLACDENGEIKMAEESPEDKTAREEKEKADAEAKKEEEMKMAEEEKQAVATGGMSEEEITKIVASQIEAVVKPMIEEAMKAVIETVGGKAEESATEEDKKKAELQYSEEKEQAEKVGFMGFVKMSAKKK